MKAAAPTSTQSHQSKANAHTVAQQATSQIATFEPPDAELFAFEDKRPEAVAQRKLQALANSSPQVTALLQLQAMINTSPRMVAQRKMLARMFGTAAQAKLDDRVSQPTPFQTSTTPVIQRTALSDATGLLDKHEDEYGTVRAKYNTEAGTLTGNPNGTAAQGMRHWARETYRAAQREYNEFHALIKEGGAAAGARLGTSNVAEPDVVKGTRLIEVKTNDTPNASDVDPLVNDALWQLHQRRPNTAAPLSVYVYLEDPNNQWPYVASDNPKTLTKAALKARLKLRGVGILGHGSAKVDYRVFYSSDFGTGANVGYQDFSGKLDGS